MSPAVMLRFHFTAANRPQTNSAWVQVMRAAAETPAGLDLTTIAEPDPS